MEKEQKIKGLGVIGIITAIAVVSILAGGGFLAYQRFAKHANIGGTVCTQEAKLCQDGSSVGRVPPSCEFTKCPGENGAAIDTSTWKTYRNEQYGFEVRYPDKYFLNTDDIALDASLGQLSLALERYPESGREGGEFVILKIFPNPRRQNVLDWLKSEGRGRAGFFSITVNGKFAYEDYTPVTVAGADGVRFSLASSGIYSGMKVNETVFGKGKLIFYFWAGRFARSDIALEQDAGRILSTFRFIE